MSIHCLRVRLKISKSLSRPPMPRSEIRRLIGGKTPNQPLMHWSTGFATGYWTPGLLVLEALGPKRYPNAEPSNELNDSSFIAKLVASAALVIRTVSPSTAGDGMVILRMWTLLLIIVTFWERRWHLLRHGVLMGPKTIIRRALAYAVSALPMNGNGEVIA